MWKCYLNRTHAKDLINGDVVVFCVSLMRLRLDIEIKQLV
jgi:hypothetical protein